MIGLLTILGFSLYDTVIVFDKVEENTHGFQHTTRRTFAEQANLAVNQTFMRSINTSLISVLPIVALMVVAVWLLGVGTLKDLALVQLVGVIVGTYSSIFFATPLLVTLRERTDVVRTHTRRVTEPPQGPSARRADGAADAPTTSRRRRRAGDRRTAAAAHAGRRRPTSRRPVRRPVRPTPAGPDDRRVSETPGGGRPDDRPSRARWTAARRCRPLVVVRAGLSSVLGQPGRGDRLRGRRHAATYNTNTVAGAASAGRRRSPGC